MLLINYDFLLIRNVVFVFFIYILLLLITKQDVLAQGNSNGYTPLKRHLLPDNIVSKELKYRTKVLENLPSKHTKYYKEIYSDLYRKRDVEIENHYYIYDDSIMNFIENIAKEIKKVNPQITFDTDRIWLSSDYSPNAFTHLDGLIVLNMGLLSICDNESQIAFVLCHELAHYQLKHTTKLLDKQISILYSEETKSELEKIGSTAFDNREKATKWLKNIIYDHTKHSRDREFEADSLAMIYLKNTRYDSYEAISCLNILDIVDMESLTAKFELEKVFNFPDFIFKKRWIEEEQTLFQNAKRVFDDSLDLDSVKTHPDCTKRAKWIQDHLSQSDKKQTKGNLKYTIKQKVVYESIVSELENDQIDLCLFHTLNLLQTYPNDIFLNKLVGHCFSLLHKAQKEHQFSAYVSLATQSKSDSYKKFLRFLNNLHLTDLSSINYYFLKTRFDSFFQDEDYLYQIIKAAYTAELPLEVAAYKKLYTTKFSKGKYIEEIQKFQ